MKPLLPFLLILLLFTLSKAQTNDSLKISTQENMPIDSIINRKMKALKIQTKLDNITKANEPFNFKNQKFMFQLSYGPGFKTSSPKTESDELGLLYDNSMDSGNSLSFLAVARVSEMNGGGNVRLGIRYNKFSTGNKDFSNSKSATFFENEVGASELRFDQSNTISFIGLAVMLDQFFGERHWFHGTFSLGHIGYKNTVDVTGPGGTYTLNFTGENLGFETLLGYRYFISNHIGVGFDLSIPMGSIKKVKLSDNVGQSLTGELEEPYSITTISPQIGLTFMF